MSRNLISTVSAVVDKLRMHVKQRGCSELAEDLNGRYTINGNSADEETIKFAELGSTHELPDSGAAVEIDYRNKLYLVSSNIDLSSSPDFLPTPASAGLLTLAFAQDLFVVRGEADDVADRVFSVARKLYIDEISPYFGRVRVYERTPGTEGYQPREVLSSILACIAASIVDSRRQHWVERTAIRFTSYCHSEARRYVGAQLFLAAMAPNQSQCYLQVYRSIESMFKVAYIESLHARIVSSTAAAASVSHKQLAACLESELSWRVRGGEALTRLISSLPPSEQAALLQLSGRADVNALAKDLYGARNSLAHGSLFHDVDGVANDLIDTCLQLGVFLFQRNKIDSSWVS